MYDFVHLEKTRKYMCWTLVGIFNLIPPIHCPTVIYSALYFTFSDDKKLNALKDCKTCLKEFVAERNEKFLEEFSVIKPHDKQRCVIVNTPGETVCTYILFDNFYITRVFFNFATVLNNCKLNYFLQIRTFVEYLN